MGIPKRRKFKEKKPPTVVIYSSGKCRVCKRLIKFPDFGFVEWGWDQEKKRLRFRLVESGTKIYERKFYLGKGIADSLNLIENGSLRLVVPVRKLKGGWWSSR